MESAIYSVDPKEFGTLLAVVDNSYGCCEVDISEIWTKDNKFFLLTASGCSCWAGEFDSREFNSLEELYIHVKGPDSDRYMYNPSLVGLDSLIAQAKAILEGE